MSEQREFADVLASLDNKIDLNRRMNETLEAMARAIFKSWFVDFDPVRTKSEEGQPLGMDAETADVFPDSFEDSIVGRIPTNWNVGKLDMLVEIHGGGTPRTSIPAYWNGDIPWFSVVDSPHASDVFVTGTEKTITKAGVDSSSAKVLPVGTTIISARGTVGELAVLGVPMAFNQSCYGIRGRAGFSDYFTYFNLRNKVDELAQSSHGTVFDTITRDTFKIVDCVIPPARLIGAFQRLVSPLLDRILSNLCESSTLTEIRGILLPNLISGEIPVKDTEKMIGQKA